MSWHQRLSVRHPAWLLIVLRSQAGLVTARHVLAWIGMLGGGASVGWIVGPILGGLLYDQFSYVMPFAAAMSVALVALLLTRFPIPRRTGGRPITVAQPGRSGCKDAMLSRQRH